MAVKLDYIISQSNFEAVRDRIASILKEEMDNQSLLHSNDLDYTADFYTERYVPVDKSEGNVIVVDIAGGTLSNQTPVTQSFECTYNIDIYTEGKETSSNTGYYNSSVKLHRLAGLVRHILQSPYYDRLNFSNGVIERRSVSKIDFANVNNEQDGSFSRMGRVTLTVNINEESNGITPIDAGGYDTVIKIEETEKGFKLTYNN
jgi:hypothetical protein